MKPLSDLIKAWTPARRGPGAGQVGRRLQSLIGAREPAAERPLKPAALRERRLRHPPAEPEPSRRGKPAPKAAGKRPRGGGKAAPPRRGRIDALGWFTLAAVVLAWPREKPLLRWPARAGAVDRDTADGEGGHRAQTAAAETAEPGRGRSAQSPLQIPVRGWKDILWRAWTDFNADNIPQVAGGVAFFGLLAIFPAMAAFVSLYGLFSDVDTARKQLSLLAGVIPGDALTLIGDQMVRIAATKHAGLGVAFVVGLLVSIWSANAGMKALFVGLNVAFEEKEKRNFLKLNLVALAFTLSAIVFLMLALGAVVVAPIVLAFVGYHGAGLALLRWPLLLVVTVGLLAMLYRYGPSRKPERWRWISWGSTLAAVLWLCVSLLFSLYVTNFGHYDKTYGSLGAVIGFMSWLWISAIAVLFGAEINSEIEHQTSVDTTTGTAKPMGQRGATMADTLGAARPAKKAARD